MAAVQLLIKDLLALLDGIAPFELAEPWDNVGLMLGDPELPVRGILAALDPTEDLLGEAEAASANVILTHHPLIFTPLKSIRLDQPIGRFLVAALRKEIAVISCHTNLDVVPQGVSGELMAGLGLAECEPLISVDRRVPGMEGATPGFGRIGSYPDAISGEKFLENLYAALEISGVQMAGVLPERIHRVAVCGGSGSSLVEVACRKGAQVLISGEIKHSEARWAEASGFCIIDAGHYPTENLVIPAIVSRLQPILADRGISVTASRGQKAPLVYRPASGLKAPDFHRSGEQVS